MGLGKELILKLKILIFKKFWLSVGVILLSLCGFWLIFQPCIDSYSVRILNLPDYISHVWPAPEADLGFLCYTRSLIGVFDPINRGIGITINTTGSLADLDTPNPYPNDADPFENRVHLYVDGSEISDSSKVVLSYGPALYETSTGKINRGDLGTEYSISWISALSLGDHKAKVIINTLTGKLLEYEWHFTIR